MDRQGGDIHRDLTPEEEELLARAREAAAKEYPEHLEFRRHQREALQEATVSGQLRRAIADSGKLYQEIAHRTGVPAEEIYAFMAGDKPLDSAAFDKLAALLNLELVTTEQ